MLAITPLKTPIPIGKATSGRKDESRKESSAPTGVACPINLTRRDRCQRAAFGSLNIG
jgi:hypothetical protein